MSRKSIPVNEGTRDRLLAYSNRNILQDQSYDAAVNELLDWLEFPSVDEIYEDYSSIWNVVPKRSDVEIQRDGFAPSVKIEPAVVPDD
jgi:hypothetical protein